MKVRTKVSNKSVWYTCVTVFLLLQMVTMMYHVHINGKLNTHYEEESVFQEKFHDTNWPTTKSPTAKIEMENTKVKSIEKKSRTLRSEGYSRAERLWKRCSGNKRIMPTVNVSQVFSSQTDDVQICPIWKVGSHTLRRIFTMKVDKEFQNLTNPYSIPWYRESSKISRRCIDNSASSKRYMYVRDPYQRLLAVYVDKVLAPNTVYWWRFGIPAIRLFRKHPSNTSLVCGHDATFSEYVKFVIASITKKGKTIKGIKLKMDMHFAPYVNLCKPCSVKYDFIGKMETFHVDVMDLLDDLDLNSTKTLLINEGSELSAEDAIRDTAYQPFDSSFTKTLKKCVGTFMALKRAWLKLQIRGLIGEQQLPVREEEAHKVTYDHFLQMVFKARERSSKNERKILKNTHLKKYFNSLDTQDLQKLSEIYSEDLRLFEYEKIPLNLFV